MDEWNRRAYQLMRTLLNNNSFSYLNLKEKINESEYRKFNSIAETGRSLENKILRGTFSFAFYLESIAVLNFPIPSEWQNNFNCSYTTWASNILRTIIKTSGLTYKQFSELLTKNGIPESTISLTRKAQRGTFRFAYFLQVEKLLRHIQDIQSVPAKNHKE